MTIASPTRFEEPEISPSASAIGSPPSNSIICGDNATIMSGWPAEIIDLVVTSPPYDGLRTYGGHSWNFEAMAAQLVRVLKPGGVIVWVVNDETSDGDETGTSMEQALHFKRLGLRLHDTMIYSKQSPAYPTSEKSVRYGQVFEFMFVLSKGKPKAINLLKDKVNRWAGAKNFGTPSTRKKNGELKKDTAFTVAEYGYRTNIWQYHSRDPKTNDETKYEHPATFPDALASDNISSWSNPGDMVLDPFAGSGTTLKSAKELNRRYVGIEINPEYVRIAEQRISQDVLMLETRKVENIRS